MFLPATVVLWSIYLTNAAPSQPHILLIVADDYGWNDIGYHGSEIKTPTLDGLAKEGVKLENYYVQPICSPTRSQLLTGRYQIHTGLQHSIIWWSQDSGLPSDSPTIAEKLKHVGYKTHAVGKWHLGFARVKYLPTSKGFDTFYGFWGGSESYSGHISCDDLHWSHVNHSRVCGLDLRDNLAIDRSQHGHYSTHLFTEKAIDIVHKHDKTKPLFLYLPYQAPHAPMEVPKKYEDMYSNIKDVNRRIYAGMVTCMDEGIRNVTHAFKQAGLWDNTILVFTTDNGGSVKNHGSNWPLRGGKGTLFEGGVRGAAFVHGNRLAKKGYVNHELMHVSDWYLTFVNLANGNLEGTKPLDGFNLWNTISHGAKSPRTELLHNIDPLQVWGKRAFADTFDNRVSAAIRAGDWKLLTGQYEGLPESKEWGKRPEGQGHGIVGRSSGQTNKVVRASSVQKSIMLYNIRDDPEERHDVSAQHPTVVRDLLDRLKYYNQTMVPVHYPPGDVKALPNLHGGVWTHWL
ncbi:arylsulfatase J isoform X1 [Patella vulgata]|uniref:arylsulfatase J isoform X1 n=1 Tax=Patella vulgata TaxID=6465 RepID=UPI0024A9706F|nr:arylsulfatase J isoform X1 [Patella vulgata]